MPSQTQSDIIATLSSCALSDIDAVLTPGECNVMLAFVDDAARNLSDLEALRAELAELRAQVSAQNDRLAHIAEYWNGERNDQAMYDALCHIVDEAGSALPVPPAAVPDVFIEHSVMRPPVKTAAVPEAVAKDAIPAGWVFYSADASIQSSDPRRPIGVMLKRDIDGVQWWLQLTEEEKERTQLYSSGAGMTLELAIQNAVAAILAAKEKGNDPA